MFFAENAGHNQQVGFDLIGLHCIDFKHFSPFLWKCNTKSMG